jgi:hypothetical protein
VGSQTVTHHKATSVCLFFVFFHENAFSEEFVILINYIFSRQLAYMCSQSLNHRSGDGGGIGSQVVTHHKVTSENAFSEEFVTLINYIFSRQLAYMYVLTISSS